MKIRWAGALFGFAAVCASACGSKETTPSGIIGTYDLRSSLGSAVAAKAPADNWQVNKALPCDLNGTAAQLLWQTFEDGPNKYVLAYRWQIDRPKAGITIEPLGSLNPTNAGTPEAVNQREIVRVRWHDNNSSSTNMGELSFSIDGAGNGAKL